jgi:DNA-directed RNA polymerase sigma subunit (sigma70/sigma32)
VAAVKPGRRAFEAALRHLIEQERLVIQARFALARVAAAAGLTTAELTALYDAVGERIEARALRRLERRLEEARDA